MTVEDLQQLERVAPALRQFDRIGVFSPWRDWEGRLFPGSTALPRWRWDLDRPGRQPFDILIASSVFMMSADPMKWFRHVLASCKYFVLIDLVRRRRTPDSEFGHDGDKMRFAIGGERPRVDRAFDLASLGDRLLAHHTYYGGANENDSDPVHVIALLRGDLAEPVLRVDDYPTGIRPIMPDLSPIHQIIERIESQGLTYRLGIVPALLTSEMMRFLRDLDYMIPCVHGYDHGYPRYAPVLDRKNDPYNERTIGTFNEFAGRTYDEIEARLQEARAILQDGLGRTVDTYIPPCNRGNRKTGTALKEAGYAYYMSEKAIPFCRLPRFQSDFYGRSNEYDFDAEVDVLTLHATWEWDVRRTGDFTSLDALLTHLSDRTRVARERHLELAAALSIE